ncbi:1740_t:CDS:1, partial [Scutellospora calospora]
DSIESNIITNLAMVREIVALLKIFTASPAAHDILSVFTIFLKKTLFK